MALTREFKDTVQARVVRDRRYRKALLREGVECLLAGDVDTGKAILRELVLANRHRSLTQELMSRLVRAAQHSR